MSRHWWRRNWWGLLALLPVLVALVLISPEEPYQAWRSAQAREAVPGEDGWVSYAGGRLRLADLAPAELQIGLGEPYPVPAGLRAWQATVVIEPPPDPTLFYGCELQIEDEQGRLFGNDPYELADAQLSDGEPFVPYLCAAPGEDEPPRFENVALFVLPEAATPVALRVSTFEGLPAYVRFEVG